MGKNRAFGSMKLFDHIMGRSLAHSVRYSSTPQNFPESVAEHSFFTAYIASVLCNLLEKEGVEVDRARAIEMALVHDVEEQLSGDILGPFKHYSPEVREAITKVNKEVIPHVFEGLPKDLRNYYITLWTEDNVGETLEAQIVKMADKISLVSKCEEEIKVGNDFFEDILSGQIESLKEDEKDWWLKIRSQVLDRD